MLELMLSRPETSLDEESHGEGKVMQAKTATLFQQAIREHKAGRLAQAETLYRKVLQHQPVHADASHNLGVIAISVGKPQDALPLLRAALQAEPRQSQYWVSCIDALIRLGNAQQAMAVLAEGRRHGLQGHPIDQLEQRIHALRQDEPDPDSKIEPPQHTIQALWGAYREAAPEEAYRLAAETARSHPCHPLAWTLMARLHRQSGRPEVALGLIERALEHAPASLSLRLQRADLLLETGRLDAAESACREALAARPAESAAHSQLAAVLLAQGRLDEAEASSRQAIALQPDAVNAYGHLSLIRHGQGRLEEAESAARHVLALRPGHVAARVNLAAILIDRGALEDAEACSREAVALAPGNAQAHLNLGVVLLGQARHREAIESLRRAIALDPGCAAAHSNLLFCLNFLAEVPPEVARAEALEYARRQRMAVGQVYRSWQLAKLPVQRLRVGFVGGDFRAHPVAYFLRGLLEGMRGSRLDLLAFPTSDIEDEVTAQLKPHFRSWRSIARLDDDTAARLIHDAGVHILVDLAGHTAHNRLPVFLRRPAPLRLTWLGYFATTGLEEIDFVLGDPHVTPVDEEDHFVERIWRLPQAYFCFAPPKAELQVAPLPALAAGHLTFGCFNSLAKLNDATIALWVRVLDAVPGSRLLLKAVQLGHAPTRERTARRFARAGLAAGRLELEGPSPYLDYLRAYARVDIALDPFPYPGGTTSAEGLWMGIPVLTLEGRRFIGHNGETILRNSGLSGWIARDEEDYVQRAAAFAADLEGLAELRARLREQVLASPLFDTRRFAADFERALWAMWADRALGAG